MKYLDYEGQIKVFKVLAKAQKFLRQIVQQKDWRAKSSLIEETTETVIDSINESFAEIMTNLSSQCQKLKKKTFECRTCQFVLKLVRDEDLKPQQQRLRRKENPHSHLKGVVAFANYGISGDYLKNLETLFHHLVAKRGAYRHVKLYRTAVDWSKITQQHKKYKDKASENCEQMEMIKSHIIRRQDECEEVMVEAREFAERFRKTPFPNPRNLSENFGLNAQLEPFASDAGDYMTTLNRLIGHFLDDLKTYRSLNVSVRRERHSFLLQPQTFAFDFPLC
ncbi:hypothetical protein JTE90_012503 [Oedothorax gibbosus]|uniref:Uncharacterized protein n=1 Tax=Oedothorax gibbosus TaxID=931172 RepID=A0AAV6V0Y5_9ARAC|nr:hypothetical protein JTE90_012503 [Oedothorax gibbosus]